MAKRVEAERTAASYIMTADDTSTAVLASEWPMARYNHAAWSVPCGSGYLCFYIFGGVASIGNPAYDDPASGVGRTSNNERTLTVVSDLWQMTQLTEPTAASQAKASADAQGQAAPPICSLTACLAHGDDAACASDLCCEWSPADEQEVIDKSPNPVAARPYCNVNRKHKWDGGKLGGKVRSSLLRASSSFWKLLGNKGHSDKGSTPMLAGRPVPGPWPVGLHSVTAWSIGSTLWVRENTAFPCASAAIMSKTDAFPRASCAPMSSAPGQVWAQPSQPRPRCWQSQHGWRR